MYSSNYRMEAPPDSGFFTHIHQSYPVACVAFLAYAFIYIAFYASIGCCLMEGVLSIYSWIVLGLGSLGQRRANTTASSSTHRGRSRVRAAKPSHNLRLSPSPSLRLEFEFDHDVADAEEFVDIEMTRSMDTFECGHRLSVSSALRSRNSFISPDLRMHAHE